MSDKEEQTESKLIKLENQLFDFLKQMDNSDSAHDLSHIKRVLTNARTIANFEGQSNLFVLTAACILHDCVNVPKNSPQRSQASVLCALKAKETLISIGFDQNLIPLVEHAIKAHSFSANIKPETPEACALQDADRLDALGAIGIARCFAVSGVMNRALFDPEDPLAEHRELDEYKWALDHFQTKLIVLHTTMQTQTGRKLAQDKTEILLNFMQQIKAECFG